VGYIGLVLLGTLVVPGRSPFEWVHTLIPPGRIRDILVYPLQHHHPITFAKFLQWADIASNSVLFFPVGLGVCWGCHHYFPGARRLLFVITFFTGLILSGCIELLQARIPHRVPSVTDVVANTSGTIVGCSYMYFRLFRKNRRAQQTPSLPEDTKHSKFSKEV
jgi:glycopeptide antibiotics resistance protein